MKKDSLDTYIQLDYMYKLKGYDVDVPSLYKTIYPVLKNVDKTLQCINSLLEDKIQEDNEYWAFMKFHKNLVKLQDEDIKHGR